MTIIKRYPNRKLYNTSTKQYITLDGIAELIRDGQDVQVVDNVSGEDLTAVTLSQIIFEQEKKSGGFLPQAVLTGLIKTGGRSIESLRRSLASPLDLIRQVDDEIEGRIHALIRQGELARDEGQRWLDKLVGHGRGADDEAAQMTNLDALLEARGVPRQGDLDAILAQLDALAAKIDDLVEDAPPDA